MKVLIAMFSPEVAQRVGIILLSAALVGVGVYDIFAALYLPPGSTVSRITFTIAKEHPILPFLVGVLVGHLFWNVG